jgi:hypothetical protein
MTAMEHMFSMQKHRYPVMHSPNNAMAASTIINVVPAIYPLVHLGLPDQILPPLPKWFQQRDNQSCGTTLHGPGVGGNTAASICIWSANEWIVGPKFVLQLVIPPFLIMHLLLLV